MILWKKLKYLLPGRRHSEDRDMQQELESLKKMAGPGELGNLTLAAENARAVWTWTWLEHLGQDLRYALRSMKNNKVLMFVVVMTLMIGIGANTAIYSFIESVLLRPLPVQNPRSLVVIKWHVKQYPSPVMKSLSLSTYFLYTTPPEGGTIGTILPYNALKLLQKNRDILTHAFCYYVTNDLNVAVGGKTEALKGQYVSGEYFGGMGVAPAAGRLILPDDDRAATADVAVLSHRYSVNHFGHTGEAVGRSIKVNGKPFVVVGVAPRGFFGAERGYVPDIYLPMHANPLFQPSTGRVGPGLRYDDPNYYWVEMMGRLKPGVDARRAQAVLAPQFRRFVEDSASSVDQYDNLPELRIHEGAWGRGSLRHRFSKPLWIMMAMTGLILLIACTNIANLLLSRASARRCEIAVRLSMGANRLRVIKQLLTESVFLALIGGILGMAVAMWGIQILTRLLAGGQENFTLHAGMNWHIVGIAVGLSVLTGLLFGLAPAIRATAISLMPALKDQGYGRHRKGLGRTLVVTQIVFSFLILAAAGLFGHTLSNLYSIKLGFNPDNVLLFTVKPGTVGYEGPALIRFYRDLRERLLQTSGIQGASLSVNPLPANSVLYFVPIDVPDVRKPEDNMAIFFQIGPSFFETLQVPLVAGREFNGIDRENGNRIVIVNREFEKRFDLNYSVGRKLNVRNETFEIVGVAEDTVQFLQSDISPAIYFSYVNNPQPPPQMTYTVRTAGHPLKHSKTVHQIVREIDPRLAAFEVKTQTSHIDGTISQAITLARLGTIWAGLALIMVCVGLYGTVTYNVVRRTSEIGIRISLGARRFGISWMVLRDIYISLLVGLAIGIPAALAGSRYLQSLLYEVEPNDPATFIVAVAALLLAGSLAGYLPARKASRIDPKEALRYE